MLSTQQYEAFHELGCFRVPGAFRRAEAEKMEVLLWEELYSRYGAKKGDVGTWDFGAVTGFQTLHAHEVFEPIGCKTTIGVIDELLGVGKWRQPAHWGQFLITFPSANPWQTPLVWHTDFGFTTPADALPGIVLFIYIADVKPQNGGTLLLEGSHRLMQQFVKGQPARFLKKMRIVRKAFMDSDPWLARLNAGTEACTKDIFSMLNGKGGHIIDGIRLKIVEATGNAGDLVVTHPWLLHTPAPNLGEAPRFMRVQRIHQK